MSKKYKLLFVLGALLVFATSVQADLARVGPTDVPSPPRNGFPLWYQDLDGTVLDLCLPAGRPADPNDPQLTACLLTPFDPGAGLPIPPYVFPGNFPEEIFYFRAVSDALDTTNGAQTKRAVLVLALEAAFANGAPAAGDQVVFSRIRVTAGVPEDGTYTVTHPYGTETFTDVQSGAGNRDIIFTQDVGIGAPGVFTGALSSRVGPFLFDPAHPNGVNLAGRSFLGDGITLTNITGSPFGTNYFEICGTRANGTAITLGPGANGCARTDLFNLTGMLHDFAAAPIGSPLTIDRSTYARNGTAAQVDVVATASAGIGQAPPVLTAAAPEVPPVLMDQPTPDNPFGQFYAQGIPVPAGTLPGTITVTNTADVPPTSVTRQVVDEVKIVGATYAPDPSGGTLTVIASSSDKGAGTAIPAPTLVLDGFPGAPFTPGDPITFTVGGLAVPPLSVTVTSEAGGQGRADVAIATPAAAAFAAGHPFAQNDVATVEAGSPAFAIAVLANDSINPAGPALAPATVAIALAPTGGGIAVANPDGTVTYTPPLIETVDTFTYTVRDSAGNISNAATVTVDVTPNAGGPIPIANPDSFTVVAGSTTILDVLANDSGNGGVLDPTSVVISTPPTVGTATPNADGTVSFTAGAAGSAGSFSYTVANLNGQRSAPALVTISVIAAGDNLTITPPATYRTRPLRWIVNGTSTVNAPNLVTVTLVRTGQIIATATPVAGAWAVDVRGSNVIPQNGDQVRATSTSGGVSNLVTVTIRQ